MAQTSTIEWTDATWNPITGCKIKSPGCTNCYAMKLAGTRMKNDKSRTGLTEPSNAGPVWNGMVRFNDGWLDQPLKWRTPLRIFVVAHGDMFYELVPESWLDLIFDRMHRAPQHLYQILTKRPENMSRYVMKLKPRDNIWLGVSVEDQRRADERQDHLRAIANLGWNTWVSYEPAIGPVDWIGWEFTKCIVSGGESDLDGKSARVSHPDWHRDTLKFCDANNILYGFKQWGAHHPDDQAWADGRWGFGPGQVVPLTFTRVGKKKAGRFLDGVEYNGFPGAATWPEKGLV